MKAYELFENVDQYEFFRRQRLKRRADEKTELQQAYIRAREIYLNNIKHSVSNYMNQRVFGFKSVYGLYDFINQTVFSGQADDEVIDTTSYHRFKYEMSQQSPDVIRKLKLLHINQLLRAGLDVKAMLSDWLRQANLKSTSIYGAIKALPPDDRKEVDSFLSLVNWLNHLQEYFSVAD